MHYHLAQINIAHILAPLDSETMHAFTSAIADINALAERSPGFVWRLVGDTGDATSIRPFGDDVIVNLTVWETVDALYQYVYYSTHTDYYRRRAEWFNRMSQPHFALWYIPAGHLPTLDEAQSRLARLETDGSTPYAFTFRQRFTLEDYLALAAPTEQQGE